MKDAILKIWKDPVWSKVISGGILVFFSILYTAIQSKIKDISFVESFQQIINNGISLKTIILVGIGILTFRYLYKKYWVQSKPEYNEDEKKIDIALLRKLKVQSHPSESSISISKTSNLVRDFSPSKIRRIEGNKSVLIIFASVFLTGIGFKFYNEPRPRYIPFYTAYDFLHGTTFLFKQDTFYFDKLGFSLGNYYFNITKVELLPNSTDIYLFGFTKYTGGIGDPSVLVVDSIDSGTIVEKSDSALLYNVNIIPNNDTTFNDYYIFDDLKLGTLFRTRLDNFDDFTIFSQGLNFVNVALRYPSYIGEEERIVLWKDYLNEDNKPSFKFISVISNVPEGQGSPLWGILFLLGIPFLIYSIRLNPFRKVKVGLTEAGRWLRHEMESDLSTFLKSKGANSYENLSSINKRKYNNIIKYYKEIEGQILK